jgi:hypothetical protein
LGIMNLPQSSETDQPTSILSDGTVVFWMAHMSVGMIGISWLKMLGTIWFINFWYVLIC